MTDLNSLILVLVFFALGFMTAKLLQTPPDDPPKEPHHGWRKK